MKNETRTWQRTVITTLIAVLVAIMMTGPAAAWAGDGPTSLTQGTTDTLTGEGSHSDNSQLTAAPAIKYRTQATNGTWLAWKKNGAASGPSAGKGYVRALQMKTSGIPAGSVQYQIHVSGRGWMAAEADGETARAAVKHSMNAIRIMLTSELSKYYSVSYRVNYQDLGWSNWRKNGGIAGSPKSKAAIRSVQVKLEKKAKVSKSESAGIVGVRYQALPQYSSWGKWLQNGQMAGTTGKALRLNALKIAVDTGAYQGGVVYRAHLTNGQWTTWMRDGAPLRPRGTIEAIQVKLTGPLAKKYDVLYRAHVSSYGWQHRLSRNGETAGVVDGGFQVEAMCIELVSKSKATGWVGSGSNWSYYQAGKKMTGSWLVTDEQPFDIMATDLQRYWLDAKGKLAIDRYIDPKTSLDANAGWTAYAMPQGYVGRGKFTNADGLLLADNDGSLYTKTRWVMTSAFDGTEQKYRLEKKGPAAIVKTGLFKVSGKLYYGWEDGRGYLMRSTTRRIGKTWYHANAEGVLTLVKNHKTKAIDRYVKWAIGIANDDSHGYSQANRWGPDYDCSSLVCASLLESGFPDSGASWTGNMVSCLRTIGFTWYPGTSGLRRGDIVLAHNSSRQHTEIFIGDSMLVGAHCSENGGIYGEPGDQTGNEISVSWYYDLPWDGHLRYTG